MASIDDMVDKGKGVVEATKDYAGREIKHQVWDKVYELGAAALGAGLGFYLGMPYETVSRALLYSFVGLSTFYTAAKLTSLPVNLYENVKSFFKFGKDLFGGGKKAESKPPSGLTQPAAAHA